jgi:hypothetical protein
VTDYQLSWRATPLWIQNHDRLDIGFRPLLHWLLRAGLTQVVVLDSGSTYPPLLCYYDSPEFASLRVPLVRAANLGPEAFWRLDFHLLPSVTHFGRYILTDADLTPDPACPLDLVRKMHEVADRPCFLPLGAKVGPALRIDDLPAHFAQRDYMRHCESDYWQRKYVEGDCWNAALDTTMSLFSAGWTRWPLADQGGVHHVRLDFPYVLRHEPWYLPTDNLPEEERFYQSHVAPGFSSSCPQPIPEEATR